MPIEEKVDFIIQPTDPTTQLEQEEYMKRAKAYEAWVKEQSQLLEKKFGKSTAANFVKILGCAEYGVIIKVGGGFNTAALAKELAKAKAIPGKPFNQQPFVLDFLFPLRETVTALALVYKYQFQAAKHYINEYGLADEKNKELKAMGTDMVKLIKQTGIVRLFSMIYLENEVWKKQAETKKVPFNFPYKFECLKKEFEARREYANIKTAGRSR